METNPDDKIVIDDLFKVTDTFSIINLVQLQPLTLKEDGSLVETEKAPKTILPLQDIVKCNTVEIKNKMKNKTMLQALTSETDSLFDKTGWGEGDSQFNMHQFSIKQMRTHISTKKAKHSLLVIGLLSGGKRDLHNRRRDLRDVQFSAR